MLRRWWRIKPPMDAVSGEEISDGFQARRVIKKLSDVGSFGTDLRFS